MQTENQRFAVRIPIELPPNYTMLAAEPRLIDGVVHRLQANKGWAAVIAMDFATEDQAREHGFRLLAALYWPAAELNIGRRTVDRIERAPTVVAADKVAEWFRPAIAGLSGPVTIAMADVPTVFRADAHPVFLGTGEVSVTLDSPGEKFFDHLSIGLGAVKCGEMSTGKLRTALDLFQLQFWEPHQETRFLLLVMVLEVLAPVRQKSAAALSIMDRWRRELDEALSDVSSAEDKASLTSLRDELTSRRTASIGARVRSFVRDMTDEETSRRAVEIYRLRSTLVHEGAVSRKDLRAATQDAFRIAWRILQTLLANPDAARSLG